MGSWVKAARIDEMWVWLYWRYYEWSTAAATDHTFPVVPIAYPIQIKMVKRYLSRHTTPPPWYSKFKVSLYSEN